MRHRIACGLMVASGFAGLGYQIVWTQQSALWLGHESAAVLAVVAAFFGGLALGSLAIGPHVVRSARPERWYAACEVWIALWSVALALLLAPVSQVLLDATGPQPSPLWQWTVAFFGTFVVLLPATAAMGATLPAMERVMARLGHEKQGIAALYACNTFGAVIGVLIAAFWLVPQFGLARTAVACALLNLGCAAAAFALPPAASAGGVHAATRAASPAALATLAATGLLGIGYEVLVVRVLSQVAQDTVYTFAMLLAVYLAGTAMGAAAWHRLSASAADPVRVLNALFRLQATTCLLGTLSLWGADRLRLAVAERLGPGMASALVSEAAPAVAAFLLPTLVMGALFAHLCAHARAEGHVFGRALGFNTLGAAVAPLLFGVILLPALGPKHSLLLVAAGYLALALPGTITKPAFWTPVAALVAIAVLSPPLAFVDVPEGGRIVSYRDGAMAAVSVVEDGVGVARLRINNRQQEGSSATLPADARQALIPLMLHPAPRHALFLGLGTGVTASSAAQDPSVQVDAVELLPEVVEASAYFTQALTDGKPSPRLHVTVADARRFVRTTDQRYDLIVADNYHPARSGTGSLYTVEHFRAVRNRLAADGVFCQWLPLHQLDIDTLRSIVRSFVAVNPRALAVLATFSLETPVLGLVARAEDGPFDVARLSGLAHKPAPQQRGGFRMEDAFGVLGNFVAGPAALARFASDAPVNTDDHPVVGYRAPRVTYVPDSQPGDRLVALLHEFEISPAELVGSDADPDLSRRLAAYWAARDRFLEAGQSVRPVADVQRMLAQVREPLLSVLRISPDFRPAYDPLLRMAGVLARSDPRAARSLLEDLQRVQPARAEAMLALRQLAEPAP
ncbi:spermidine synthase [Variovorax sp. J2P1-59]|uniref:spermine/spermidine synthase domain-containing protein n=1 Tax=Variovorax flavidus TaxID=3053501 RepID=UPI002574B7D4|nr:spermidine synthase [Variovorax sp. J2P1-59]MDM0078464.1 spermidine synthase [Variovorax sp. J2P1-59]